MSEIEKRIRENTKLADLLRAVDRMAAQEEGNFPPAAKRAITLSRTLTRDIARDFEGTDIEELRDCLYATLLLVHCKNAAIGVKRSAWEAIEARILLPPA